MTPTKATLDILLRYTKLVEKPVADHKLHVTLGYDRNNPENPVEVKPKKVFVGFVESAELLGPDKNILALAMNSPDLTAEHERIHAGGLAKYDFNPYLPHVTLTYDSNEKELAMVRNMIGEYQNNMRVLTFSNQKRRKIEE